MDSELKIQIPLHIEDCDNKRISSPDQDNLPGIGLNVNIGRIRPKPVCLRHWQPQRLRDHGQWNPNIRHESIFPKRHGL